MSTNGHAIADTMNINGINIFIPGNLPDGNIPGYDQIEAELKSFEAEERIRLGLEEKIKCHCGAFHTAWGINHVSG